MLKERYDDTSMIIQKHIKSLFEIPTVVKEDHTVLRRMLGSFLKHLHALKALRRLTERWDDLMIYLVTSRLDQKNKSSLGDHANQRNGSDARKADGSYLCLESYLIWS